MIQQENEHPHFTHDCDVCTFLGHFNGYDLYVHATEGIKTVIARNGEDGAYKSGIWAANSDPELAEAKKRAIERGLLVL